MVASVPDISWRPGTKATLTNPGHADPPLATSHDLGGAAGAALRAECRLRADAGAAARADFLRTIRSWAGAEEALPRSRAQRGAGGLSLAPEPSAGGEEAWPRSRASGRGGRGSA